MVFYPLGMPFLLPVNYTTIGFGYVLSVAYQSATIGFIVGILSISAGVMISAVTNFYLGRYLMKGCVTELLLSRFRQLHAIDTAISAEPVKMVFLLRFVPIPFSVVSYVMGIS